jgi:hypothetical protein
MQRHRCALILLLLLAVCVLAGCAGGSGDRQPVTGLVTYKGEPLQNGSIEFIPHPGVKTSSGAMITNGRFTIPTNKGLDPGIYTVKISAQEGGGATDEPGGLPGKEPKELIPAKYNSKSTLTKEVKKGDTNFEFKLD